MLVQGELWVLRQRRSIYGVSLGRPVGTMKEKGYGVSLEKPLGTTAEEEDDVSTGRPVGPMK